MADQTLPPSCWSTHPVDGGIIQIKRGERGYYATDFDTLPATMADWDQWADWLNTQCGITPAERLAMEYGSLFGWNTPGANPARLREKA